MINGQTPSFNDSTLVILCLIITLCFSLNIHNSSSYNIYSLRSSRWQECTRNEREVKRIQYFKIFIGVRWHDNDVINLYHYHTVENHEKWWIYFWRCLFTYYTLKLFPTSQSYVEIQTWLLLIIVQAVIVSKLGCKQSIF